MSLSTVRCENCETSNRVPAVAEGRPRCGHCGAALPWITDVGDEDFAAVVDQASLPVLVDLWAPWCAPCRQVSPALEQLAREKAGQLKLVKVDIDQAPMVARRFAVRAVPTLMVLHRGEVLASQRGAAPVDALRRWLEQALSRPPAAAQREQR